MPTPTRIWKCLEVELGVPPERLLILRHSNEQLDRLKRFGVSIEEYTALQPVGSKYDFFVAKPEPASHVVVVAYDRVAGVFEIEGVQASASQFELGSEAYRAFDSGRKERQCHLFRLKRVGSALDGLQVAGWEGRTRTPVQRICGLFFDELTVSAPLRLSVSADALSDRFEQRVATSAADTDTRRQERLSRATGIAERVQVITTAFLRDEDVVAVVLRRADGHCERCGQPAPFRKKSDNSPYLEVHHTVPLKDGGADTVANAEALCPNCHRKAHFGQD